MTAKEESDRSPFVEQVYRTDADGVLLVYEGDLRLRSEGRTWRSPGNIKIRLGSGSRAWAEFAGNDRWIADCAMKVTSPLVEVPEGSNLRPPHASEDARQSAQGGSYAHCSIHINGPLDAGDPRKVQRLLLHVTGVLTDYPLPAYVSEEGWEQGQLSFSLPGWTLRLVKANPDSTIKTDFTYLVHAVPARTPIDEKEIQRLVRRVFLLLRLVGSGGIGIGPRVGMTHDGEVVWASWGASRSEPAGQRWCPDQQVLTAVPVLAKGIAALAKDDGLEACVDRAVSLLLATNSPGVLDVKVPVACTGLELLAWAVLQHRQWLTPEALNGLTAGARARLLMMWAGIPIELPGDYKSLAARRGRIGQPAMAGPELIYEIRNRLIHPPKKLSDPEWPAWEEQFEALQLANWYLELAVLRVLGYDDNYASRLKANSWAGAVEPVPWL
jgi:hypothetical protein